VIHPDQKETHNSAGVDTCTPDPLSPLPTGSVAVLPQHAGAPLSQGRTQWELRGLDPPLTEIA